jgi:hypothetical protein
MKSCIRFGAVLLLVLGCTASLSAKRREPLLSSINFLVVRDESGKPIRNAAVVLHPVDEDGKQERGGFELKTDPEGKASYDGIPYGKLRIQVLSPGFQTYGEDFDVSQPNMEITVKMKRPAKQYSIYEEHPAEKKEEPKKPQE